MPESTRGLSERRLRSLWDTTLRILAQSRPLAKKSHAHLPCWGRRRCLGCVRPHGSPSNGQVTRTGDCTAQFECKNGGTLPGATYFHYGYSAHAAGFAGGLWPGSYATTIFGLTGSQAKKGLALPHEAPPDAVYVVKPAPCTPIIGPTPAEPKFGQPGLLPEVQFPEGTGPGTVGPPIPILPGGPALPTP